MNYFAVEHNGECRDHIVLADSGGNAVFTEFLSMTYDEMKDSEWLEDFVLAVFDVYDDDEETAVTLIGDDECFIWGIIIGLYEGEVRYSLVNWKQDDKRFRYAT